MVGMAEAIRNAVSQQVSEASDVGVVIPDLPSTMVSEDNESESQTDTDTNVEAEKVDKTSLEETKDETGVQKRINKLTYQNKLKDEKIMEFERKMQELENKLNTMSTSKESNTKEEIEEVPDFDTTGEMMDYIKTNLLPKLVEDGVSAKLSETSKKMLENETLSAKEKMVNTFRDDLVTESKLFEDGEFIGTESQRQALKEAYDLYSSNPESYDAIAKKNRCKNTAEFLFKLTNGEVITAKEKLDDILSAADKSSTLKGSGDNVLQVPFKKGTGFKSALNEALEKLMKQ